MKKKLNFLNDSILEYIRFILKIKNLNFNTELAYMRTNLRCFILTASRYSITKGAFIKPPSSYIFFYKRSEIFVQGYYIFTKNRYI